MRGCIRCAELVSAVSVANKRKTLPRPSITHAAGPVADMHNALLLWDLACACTALGRHSGPSDTEVLPDEQRRIDRDSGNGEQQIPAS